MPTQEMASSHAHFKKMNTHLPSLPFKASPPSLLPEGVLPAL